MLAAGPAGCGGSGGDGAVPQPKTLTYWASNQGRSIQQDQQVLGPELKKFEQQTGIKVKLEVIGWPDLLNRILAATSSGQGPDVLNVGNTWSASLQATGAFQAFDDKTHRQGRRQEPVHPLDAHLHRRVRQAAAVRPALRPRVRALLQQEAVRQGRHRRPAADLAGTRRRRAEAHRPGKKQYGVGILGASYTEGAHFAFMFGAQQGAKLFQAASRASTRRRWSRASSSTSTCCPTDKVVDPSDAEYVNDSDVLKDFADGKSA